MKKLVSICALSLCATLSALTPAMANSFNISTSSTTAQSLSAGQTGTITSTGTLNVSGSNVAVTFTGSATFTNNGLLEQSGSARALRDNTGGITESVTNTGTIETVGDDAYQVNKAGSTVTLTNSGLIEATGAGQGLDWAALNTNTGTNTIINTGTITAADSDAVRPGQNGTVQNDGLIKSTPGDSGNDGIDGQNNLTITVINASANTTSSTIEGARHGITNGDAKDNITMTITNNALGTIKGDNGSGINIDGFATNGVTTETVTVINHGLIQGNGNTILTGETTADGDGVDVDGVVNITNTGTIVSLNSVGTSTETENSEGITVGGGTITNSGLVAGEVSNSATQFAIGRGITLAGVDKDSSGNPIPIQSIYSNTVVTNLAGGQIIGGDDAGIAIEGSGTWTPYSVTINNNAGASIEGNFYSATEGGGTTVAAIEAGVAGESSNPVANNITINNAGVINGNTSGKAIDFGVGTNTLNITGGQAQVIGSINGNTGTTTVNISPGSGNSFGYTGTITGNTTVNVAAGGSFAVGGTQSGSTASGKLSINTAQFTNGTGSNSAADFNVANSNLTFALGAADSNTQILLAGGVNTSVTFSAATVSINDLDGSGLDVGHEYVLIGGDGAHTTYTGLSLDPANGAGLQEITGGLSLVYGSDAFAQNYGGSQLFYDGANGNIDVIVNTPEPGTWGMILVGLGALVVLRLRKGASKV
jgi:hypothetical protein